MTPSQHDDTLVRLAWALLPLVFVVGGSVFLAVYLSGAVRTGGNGAVPIAFGVVAILVGIAGIVAMVGGLGRKS